MNNCNVCGERIVFRYLDGRPTPIHINGNRCRGYREANSASSSPFRSPKSYVIPNASCPVCGETVFFYQSPNGGRVFFDDLRWPWPKHACTDNKKSRGKPQSKRQTGNIYVLRSRSGGHLALYDLDDTDQSDHFWKFVFRRQNTNKRRTACLKKTTMKKGGLRIDDFFDAPSFIVDLDESNGDHLRVDFICGRLGKIVRIKMFKKCDEF